MTELNLYEIKHMLKDFKHFPEEALSAISYSDIDEYETEYIVYEEKTREDIQTRRALYNKINSDISILFEKNSKQHKYFIRAYHKEEGDVVSIHSKKYTPPKQIMRRVKDAKDKYEISSASSAKVDKFTMDNIDECISYLIENGFVFGKDFNANNAIDIATGVATDNIMKDVSKSLTPTACSSVIKGDTVYQVENVEFDNLYKGNVTVKGEGKFAASVGIKNGSAFVILEK